MRRVLLAIALVAALTGVVAMAAQKFGPVETVPGMPVHTVGATIDGQPGPMYLSPWWPVKPHLTEGERRDLTLWLDAMDEHLAIARGCAVRNDIQCVADRVYRLSAVAGHQVPRTITKRPEAQE